MDQNKKIYNKYSNKILFKDQLRKEVEEFEFFKCKCKLNRILFISIFSY